MILSFFIFIIVQIKGKEESNRKYFDIKLGESPIFSDLNNFKIISGSDEFSLKVNSKSMAYFDSVDKNSIIYISKNTEVSLGEKITGKFYIIEPNILYYVSIKLYNNSEPSVLKRYVFPMETIDIEDADKLNFIYLQQNKVYRLGFNYQANKIIMKLSRKTINSKVIINRDNIKTELNQNSLYYSFEKYNGKLSLEIKDGDAFIEFLHYNDDKNSNLFKDISLKNYELTKDTSIIKLDYTQKIFKLKLESKSQFLVSLTYGFTNDINCIYDFSLNSQIISYGNSGNNYYIELTLHSLFKNITLSENEAFSIAIKTEKQSDQPIYISYEQNCDIYWILDEVVNDQYCKDVIKNIKDILDIYVYTDIAQTPPDITNYPNYHHRKIDLKDEISKISTSNRKFYEFYQDIKKILTTVKDLHFNIEPLTTPKKYDFSKYYAFLPFDFEIKYYNKEYRIFIAKDNSLLKEYDKDSQDFINNHLNIPLKSINNIDPFDYIQNWSKFRATKNPHSQFTNIIKAVSYFRLVNYPLNYSELIFNEYEFDDDKVLRLSYKFYYPKQNIIKSFNKYFLNYLKKYDVQEIPSFRQIYNNFLMRNDKKKILKLENNNINNQNWDVIYKDKGNKIFKCKVDKANKVNVIVQNSFSLEFQKGIGTILKCAKLFYSNNFPIFIIESKNGGGFAILSILMTQIFQTRILFRRYISYKITDISKKYFEKKIMIMSILFIVQKLIV